MREFGVLARLIPAPWPSIGVDDGSQPKGKHDGSQREMLILIIMCIPEKRKR